MIDKWFIKDIDEGLKNGNRFVVIDEESKCDFLLSILEKRVEEEKWKLFIVKSELEELKAKYEIEKNLKDKNVVIFTTRPLQQLKYIREYCETCGALNISHLHRYIAEKVKTNFGFDISGSPEEIIGIGKFSIGKKKDFWERIKLNGGKGLFIPGDILDFLLEPEKTYKSYSKEEKKLFEEYMSELTDATLANKPCSAIAKEIAFSIFEKILYDEDNSFVKETYKLWIDSKKYEKILNKYAEEYKIPKGLDIWSVSINHPFRQIDNQWLNELCKNIEDKKWIESKLLLINERAKQPIADVVGISYWKSISAIFSYNSSGIDGIRDIDSAIKHYRDVFYKIDSAIRHLYSKFMAEPDILKPIQNYYRKILDLYLDKWFKYFETKYKENQTGLLSKIITENEPPTVIIVGDAISYELCMELLDNLNPKYNKKVETINSNFPSITENNMSSLFSGTGELIEGREKRNKALFEETKKEIVFDDINNFSLSKKAEDYLVLYSADIDQISGKQDQGALKFYDTYVEILKDKIEEIFKAGYKKVFIVSDHGFALTGILEDSDKIDINVSEGEKKERYCLSKNKIAKKPNNIIEIKKKYKDYNFLYFSNTINPFLTKNPYGFSHGGITPEELLTPLITIEKAESVMNELQVSIINKKELIEAVGNLFEVKIEAKAEKSDIFNCERKIQIIFYKDKKEFNKSDIITIKDCETVKKEFKFDKYDEFDVLVVDAGTQNTLDSCKVSKKTVRDLGGLL